MRREGQDLSKPWYDQPKTFVTPFQLRAPYDNVWVGEDPGDGMTKEYADQWDAIVNVSSTKCATFEPSRPDQRTYWFPIIEMGRWPIVYLLWLKEVMDFHHSKGHKIYLHCHAGAYRSPSTAVLWLQSRGHNPEQALNLVKETKSSLYRLWKNYGNIPKRKDEVFDMFHKEEESIKERGYGTLCIESLLTYGSFDPWDQEVISGKYRIIQLLHHYFWFYYKPKWWINERWQYFKYWAFNRYGWISKGAGTHFYTRKYFWAFGNKAEPAEENRKVGEFKWVPNQGWYTVEEWNDKTHKWEKIEKKL